MVASSAPPAFVMSPRAGRGWISVLAFAAWSCYASGPPGDGTGCPPGQVLCDGECRDLLGDPTNCGACGRACVLPRSHAGCRDGTCVVEDCAEGFGDCDGLDANGCEADLGRSDTHCGSCDLACELPGADAACDEGRCAIAACSDGFADCDAAARTGCEVEIRADPANCGGCGHACTAPTGIVECVGGRCVITGCPVWAGDCNDEPADGCEADLLWDGWNCGSCGRICLWWGGCPPACNAGDCYSMEGPNFVDCDCDPTNGLEVFCPPPFDCDVCPLECSGAHGLAECHACHCRMASCDPGFADCNGNVSDGCETGIQSDDFNCGACRVICPVGSHCNAGACV